MYLNKVYNSITTIIYNILCEHTLNAIIIPKLGIITTEIYVSILDKMIVKRCTKYSNKTFRYQRLKPTLYNIVSNLSMIMLHVYYCLFTSCTHNVHLFIFHIYIAVGSDQEEI